MSKDSPSSETKAGEGSRDPYIEVALENGSWNWMLFSGNGRALATNVISYKERHDCTEAIRILIEMVKEKKPKVVIIHED